jgi:hypothetical protein
MWKVRGKVATTTRQSHGNHAANSRQSRGKHLLLCQLPLVCRNYAANLQLSRNYDKDT